LEEATARIWPAKNRHILVSILAKPGPAGRRMAS